MFEIETKERYELVEVTEKVEKAVKESGVKDGLVVVAMPHSTAGVLITENESGLRKDWLSIFESIVAGHSFKHDQIDNNADSHILSGLIGQSKVLPIGDGRLVRGAWQQIFVAEFDGPRRRKVIVKVLQG